MQKKTFSFFKPVSMALIFCFIIVCFQSCIKRKQKSSSQVTASAITLSAYLKNSDNFRPNHGELNQDHVQTAEEYIKRWLKIGETYDVEKIQNYIERLEKEKQSLAEDLYETRLLEKLEMEITSFKKAKKSALKKMNDQKSALLIAYNQYLIPRITKLLELVQKGIEDQRADALVDEFISIYTVFYLPNAPRKMVHQDLDYLAIAKNVLGYIYKKRQKHQVHANNLVVPSAHLGSIKSCLKTEAKAGDYIKREDLEKLVHCGFDISRLNPGKSALWTQVTHETVGEVKDMHIDWFPKEDETIHYKHMKYSSAGSPKLKAYFKRNGKKVDIKIKMGFEVHSQIASSILGRLVGFYHNPVIHRPLVKIYLGKTTLSGFKAQWERKYKGNLKEWAIYMHSHGKTDDGKEWVVLRDVNIAVDDPSTIKLGPFHPEGWDQGNRREYRAMVLFYGWLSLLDTKAGNHRAFLRKTDQGFEPIHSLSDIGFSLNMSVDLRHPWHMFRIKDRWGVNNYHPSLMSWDKKKVHIWWSEGMLDMERFTTTTYEDVKWMARRIADIQHEDIKYATIQAGYPSDVGDLFVHKITNRRNEIVKAFELEDEYPLYPVVDLDSYSPNENVKNGMIVKTHYEGYTNYEISRDSYFPYVLDYLAQTIDMVKLHGELSAKISSAFNLSGSLSKQIWDGMKGKVLSVTGITPGLKVTVNRTVDSNKALVNYSDNSQAFYVKDSISIEIDVNSGFFSEIIERFPISGSAKWVVWRRDFELIQFGDTWADAARAPIKIFPFIMAWKKMIAHRLDAGEMFKVSDSYGFGASVSGGYSDGVEVKASLGYSWHKARPIYFYRDSMGQLSVYKEKTSAHGANARLAFANINAYIVDLPTLDLSFSYRKFKGNGALYQFKMPQYDIGLSTLDYNQRQRDHEALQLLLNGGNDDVEVEMHRELALETEGWRKSFNAMFLLFWKKDGAKGYSQAKVKLPGGKERVFHRFYSRKKGLLGSDEVVSFRGNKSLTVAKRNMRSMAVEMDAKKPENMMILIEVGDYHRKFDLEGLEEHIEEVNDLFSKSADEPFFRNYVLPPKEEVDTYRKLYTRIRMYVQGEAIYSKFMKYTDEDLDQIARNHFNYHKKIDPTNKPSEDDNDFETYTKYQTLRSDLIWARNKLNRNKEDPEDFLSAVNFLMARLTEKRNIFSTRIKHHEKGVALLKAVFSEKKMFVMGEIFGVFPSFSTIQQDEALVKRRFAGKSWGKFGVVPPIRKFLHDNKLTPSSVFISGGLGLQDIFGELPVAKSVEFY